MIDSHCHLNFAQFDADRERVIQDSINAGVTGCLLPGVVRKDWDSLFAVRDMWPVSQVALGLHPCFSDQHHPDDLAQLSARLKILGDHVCAVGEIGLDFSPAYNHPSQIGYFLAQLDIAHEVKLPVVLHHRQSHNALIQHIKANKFQFGGVVHAFSGSYQTAKTYVDMGFCLGIGGTITYPRANKTLDAVKKVGLEHLLLETDAPDMPMNGKQGQRNSPINLPKIAFALAQLLDCSVQIVANTTTANFYRVFEKALKP